MCNSFLAVVFTSHPELKQERNYLGIAKLQENPSRINSDYLSVDDVCSFLPLDCPWIGKEKPININIMGRTVSGTNQTCPWEKRTCPWDKFALSSVQNGHSLLSYTVPYGAAKLHALINFVGIEFRFDYTCTNTLICFWNYFPGCNRKYFWDPFPGCKGNPSLSSLTHRPPPHLGITLTLRRLHLHS